MMRKNLVELVTSSLFSSVMVSAKRSTSRMAVRDRRGKVFFSCASITSRYKRLMGLASRAETSRLPKTLSTSVSSMVASSTFCTRLEKASSTDCSMVPARNHFSAAKGALRLYTCSGSSTM